MIDTIIAGVALGLAASAYLGSWIMIYKSRQHWRFMYVSLEARLSLLEEEFNRHYEIDHDQDAKGKGIP